MVRKTSTSNRKKNRFLRPKNFKSLRNLKENSVNMRDFFSQVLLPLFGAAIVITRPGLQKKPCYTTGWGNSIKVDFRELKSHTVKWIKLSLEILKKNLPLYRQR